MPTEREPTGNKITRYQAGITIFLPLTVGLYTPEILQVAANPQQVVEVLQNVIQVIPGALPIGKEEN